MKTDKRPYAGSWSLDFQQRHRTVVSWTPDAVVQFNGDTTLPGCPQCRNRIDFASFINTVNVGGGVDSGGATCSINMTIPKAYGDLVYKDGKFILETGVEINVYLRGFFKTSELTVKGDNLLLDSDAGTEEIELDKIETRPYYPVFHGFISAVSVDYSDNSYKVSISTRSMLSLWENQMINTQQGFFAANPKEARGTINLKGHVYTGMTAHQIIYDLYKDAGGSPEGTNFVLQQKSNLNGKIATGQQFYSLYLRYLENRWRNGLYNLKLFGVSGRQYNTLERNILVDTTPFGRDNQFKKVVKQQLKEHTITKRNQSSALSVMMKAGMIAQDPEGKLVRGLDVRQLPSIEGQKEDPVNILSLQEFITDLGSLGQVNFMNSDFSSKLELANRVAERVGYEFYQDVDGDLVFKPPMYNMNTAGDRVYTITRQHTLSISYSHEEPEYTYVVCSGGPFRNIKVSSLEGEWGVKGMYVDYKLVAKYGWKQMSFDTTYYNSARKAFYAAVVALDSANKKTESCDISIPLRPELKQGYPVYVEENDCFYYVESVAHNFSFGGECTTQLTLTCQRKKFIPPGDPNTLYAQDPARAVDLGDPSLPQKIIYRNVDRQDGAGGSFLTKKIVGFPNVVLALDPYKMDPGFLTFSLDYQSMGRLDSETRRGYREMLIMEGFKHGIIQAAQGGDMFSGPWTVKIGDQIGTLGLEKEGTTYLRKAGRKPSFGKLSRKQIQQQSVILGESALETATFKKTRADQKASQLAGRSKYATGSRIDQAESIREAAQRDLEQEIESLRSPEGSTTMTIYDLILAIRKEKKLYVSEGQINPANLLRLLENKKSSFAPHLPGYYRYFSSSHPSPEHQGPPIPSYKTIEGEEAQVELYYEPAGTTEPSSFSVVKSDPQQGGEVVQFVEEQAVVKRGLYARTLLTNGFQVVPTKDIKTLTFQVNFTVTEDEVEVGRRLDPTKWESEGSFGASFRRMLSNNISAYLKKRYAPNLKVGVLQREVFSGKGDLTSFFYNEQPLDPSLTFSQAVPNLSNKNSFARGLTSEINAIVDSLMRESFPELYVPWLGTSSDRAKMISRAINFAQKQFRINIIRDFYKGQSRKEVRKSFKKGNMYSPVFPVSDDQGYEVFGAYQYGRGLKPARNTLFDAILKVDPLGILTEKQLAELRSSLASFESRESFEDYTREVIRTRMDSIFEEDFDAGVRIYASYGLDIDNEALAPNSALRHEGIINLMMTRTNEQVITNIPRSLAEVAPDTRGEAMCSCKGTTSEAELIYSALDLQNTVVEVENPLLARAMKKSKDNLQSWESHQKALRGQPISGASTPVDLGGVISREFNEIENTSDAIAGTLEQLTDLSRFNIAKAKRGS
jgi:hypothetical protein